MQTENAKLAEIEQWLRDCHSWLMSTDLDMQCPMDTDPLDLADDLAALRAQAGVDRERAQTLSVLLQALADDCDSTDGWEGAAPDLREAASILAAIRGDDHGQ